MSFNRSTAVLLGKVNNGITVIAASKTRTAEEIQLAKQTGFTHFGENYVQEAFDKKDVFKDVTLHMIGKLQSNKAKQAVSLFDVIHTVNSIKLASKLNKYCIEQNKTLDIFIQLNIAEEPQKNGIYIEDINPLLESIKELSHLNVLGFMVIPPNNQDPVPFFKQAQALTKQYGFKYLSMGMSNDYEEAIKNGATHIRVGRAIFGERI